MDNTQHTTAHYTTKSERAWSKADRTNANLDEAILKAAQWAKAAVALEAAAAAHTAAAEAYEMASAHPDNLDVVIAAGDAEEIAYEMAAAAAAAYETAAAHRR